jgi:hypothetical protein
MIDAKIIKEEILKVSFPKLMIGPNSSIVLFTDASSGTIIIKGGGTMPIGTHFTTFNPSLFEEFKDEVVLKNI